MKWKYQRLYKKLIYPASSIKRYGHLVLTSNRHEGETVHFAGWFLDRTHKVGSARVIVSNANFRKAFDLDITPNVEISAQIGASPIMAFTFDFLLIYRSGKEMSVKIEYDTESRSLSEQLGVIPANCSDSTQKRADLVFQSNAIANIDDFQHILTTEEKTAIPDGYQADVVVPIYNGLDLLQTLLSTIEQTRVPHNLYLIDDASTEESVPEYLAGFAKERPNVYILRNEKNLGFTETVNRGLSQSENDVVIVNTDVVLPDLWLERMVAPLIRDNKIASATPFTNSGTICSFPRYMSDNDVVFGLNANEVDSAFRSLRCLYPTIPTGVGFCMAMSRNAMNEIGVFDAKTYGRGYGEENDWCLRAIEAGFRNVQVDNLFVIHHHGGSFSADEKQQLNDEHAKIRRDRYPNYEQSIENFSQLNPMSPQRNYALASLIRDASADSVLVFNHSLGGGATHFLNKKKAQILDSGSKFICCTYDSQKKRFAWELAYDGQTARFNTNSILAGMEFLQSVDRVLCNELVTFPDIGKTLSTIREWADNKSIPITYYVHDYYSICPQYTLVGRDGRFCNLPSDEECNACMKCLNTSCSFESIRDYRKAWGNFLLKCEEVIVFSLSSKQIISGVYPELKNIKVVPHEVVPLDTVKREIRQSKGLVVGCLGAIDNIKGYDELKKLNEFIENSNKDSQIIIIGYTLHGQNESNFEYTGAYARNELPKIVKEKNIDIFFQPSICPETFSFTTSEIMSMGCPIAVFNIGAPAERVEDYEKGIVIPIDTPVDEIYDLLEQMAFDRLHLDDLPVKN